MKDDKQYLIAHIKTICVEYYLISDLYNDLTWNNTHLLEYSLEFYNQIISAKLYISCFIKNDKLKWAIIDVVDIINKPHSDRLPETVFYEICNTVEELIGFLKHWLNTKGDK